MPVRMEVNEPRKLSGTIWREHPRERARIVAKVCRTLEMVYGKGRLGNPKVPLDDLVFIIISNKTSPVNAERTYQQLKKVYTRWDQVIASPVARLRAILKPAGLSRVKSRQIWLALRKIKNDLGAYDLVALKGEPDDVVQNYLTSLSGVSEKVAKCVMMYTMGAQVLPVDVHVHRVATRLGWTLRKRADQCHEELESLVPPKWRYAFHVGSVLHGRRICRPNEPICQSCCLSSSCEYFKKSMPQA